MISENTLTHGNFLSPLQTLRPESQIFNAFLIAILTTILSYQLTASIFDIGLGFKSSSRATARNFHIKLLTDESSILTVIAAVFRSQSLDFLRFRRDISRETKIDRRKSFIRPITIFILSILLATAPIMNLLSIVLVLERDETYTFAQTKFGGVVVSEVISGKPLQRRGTSKAGDCSNFVFTSPIRDARNIADFYICFLLDLTGNGRNNPRGNVDINLRTTAKAEMVVEIVGSVNSSGFIFDSFKRTFYGLVVSQGEGYRVPFRLTEEGARGLFSIFRNTAVASCDPPKAQEVLRSESGLIHVTESFPCGVINSPDVLTAMEQVTEMMSFVDAEELLLVKEDDLLEGPSVTAEFVRGDDIELLQIRKSMLNIGILGVVTGACLLLRLILKIFTNNDVNDGLEATLKSGLGVPCSQSLIYSDMKVNYMEKFKVRGSSQGMEETVHKDNGSSASSDEKIIDDE